MWHIELAKYSAAYQRGKAKANPYGDKHLVPISSLDDYTIRSHSLIEPQFHNISLLGAGKHLRYVGVLDIDFNIIEALDGAMKAKDAKVEFGNIIRKLRTREAVCAAYPEFAKIFAEVGRLVDRLGDRCVCYFTGCRGFRILFIDPELFAVGNDGDKYGESAIELLLKRLGFSERPFWLDESAGSRSHGIKPDLLAHSVTGLHAVRWPCEVLVSDEEDVELSADIVRYWQELAQTLEEMSATQLSELPRLVPEQKKRKEPSEKPSIAPSSAKAKAYLRSLHAADDCAVTADEEAVDEVRRALSSQPKHRSFFIDRRRNSFGRSAIDYCRYGLEPLAVGGFYRWADAGQDPPRSLRLTNLGSEAVVKEDDARKHALDTFTAREERAMREVMASPCDSKTELLLIHRQLLSSSEAEAPDADDADSIREKVMHLLPTFPQCIQRLIGKFKRTGQLKDAGRMHLFSFFRAVGIVQANAVRFVARASKNNDEYHNRLRDVYRRKYNYASGTIHREHHIANCDCSQYGSPAAAFLHSRGLTAKAQALQRPKVILFLQ